MKMKGKTGSRAVSAAFILAAAALFFLVGAILAYRLLPAGRPEPAAYEKRKSALVQDYISHRGDSKDWTEHTFAAYDHAIAKGSRYIEQDLVLSADGTLWVSHDWDPYRLSGVHGNFADMSDEEIGSLVTRNGEPFHTLQEVAGRYGNSVWYVPEVRDKPGMLEKFIQFVQKNRLEENVIVQVWNLEQARILRETFPEIPILFLVRGLPDMVQSIANPSADIICIPKEMADPYLVEWIHQSGKLAAVWTLDTEEEIRAMKEMGVDLYFTDDTGLAERESGK